MITGTLLLIVALACKIISVQIGEDVITQNRGKSTRSYEEVLPPQRGRIMTCDEALLTNNVVRFSLVGDYYHLVDVNNITWPLAYAKAFRNNEWKELEAKKDGEKKKEEIAKLEFAQEKIVKKMRMSMLSQLKRKEGGNTDGISTYARVKKNFDLLCTIYNKKDKEDSTKKSAIKDNHDEAKVREYVNEYGKYAASVLGYVLDDKTEKQFYDMLTQDAVEKKRQNIVVASNLTLEEKQKLEEVIRRTHLLGFRFEIDNKRVYNMPDTLVHVTGYMGFPDNSTHIYKPVPLAGVEQYMNNYLTGYNGVTEYARDARGRIIPSANARFRPASHGLNVKLTIDLKLQAIAEEELDKAMAINSQGRRCDAGCIIMIEVKTGRILAMASRPTYNLQTRKDLGKGASNFALSLYQPGSTFKIVPAVAALRNKASVDTMVSANTLAIPGSKVTAKGRGGSLPIWQMLQKSDNAAAVNTGKIAKASGLKETLLELGFLNKTGIELPNDPAGSSQDVKNMANFMNVCYGYAVTVTPLQMAMCYAAIANNGKRMKAHLVEGVYNNEGVCVERFEPTVAAEVLGEAAAKSLVRALHTVTQPGGTGTMASISGVNVAGKTGTAKKTSAGGYASSNYVASFIGMVPMEDPEIVCAVVIDNPSRHDVGIGGGTVAAPVFRDVMSRALVLRKVQGLAPDSAVKKDKPASPTVVQAQRR